jgi:hypothetical protein
MFSATNLGVVCSMEYQASCPTSLGNPFSTYKWDGGDLIFSKFPFHSDIICSEYLQSPDSYTLLNITEYHRELLFLKFIFTGVVAILGIKTEKEILNIYLTLSLKIIKNKIHWMLT